MFNGMFGKWYAGILFDHIMHVIETNPIFDSRSPMHRINALFDPMMKRGIRPVRYVVCQSVFNRVVMQIVEVVLVVAFVAQRMFPEPPLPDAAPTIAQARCGHRLFGAAQSQPVLGKAFFDDAPAVGVVAVILRHGPDRVNMVRQYNQRIDMKRQVMSAMPNRLAQTIPRPIICQNARPPFRHHGKEKRSARQITTAIIRQVNLRKWIQS